MTQPDIRPAAASESDKVMATLTLAFQADPVFRYWLPTPSDYLTWFPRFAYAMGERGFAHGTATVLGEFDACALWLPPGVEPDPAQMAGVDMPGDEQTAKTGAELRAAMAQHHPSAPHWYLWMIGVDPRFQGKGMGSALLKHMLQRIDREGADAYLESSDPRNVPLYQRHGFEVTAVIQVRDVPPITPMFRPARR